MKKIILSALTALLLGFTAAFAQTDCGGGRYSQEIFSGFDLTSNITYGSNINLQGNTQSLELDIYQPTGDTEPLRPLIVWEHGGSFLGGDKAGGDITSLVHPLTRMGFVNASCEYRLGMNGIPFPGPDSADASEAVWRAVADMKAAVRFFYKDVIDNGNQYRIDTNRIYIAGVSAGAVSAIHYAYLNDIAEMPSYIDTTKPGLGGGIEGASGNQGYSSTIHGVINVCGMIADTAWIHAGDVPIVSLHGTDDGIVPYGTAVINVAGIYQIFEVDGSSSIHDRMAQEGVENCLYTHNGADHTPHISSQAYLDTTLNVITNFMSQLVCGVQPQCGFILANEAPVPTGDIAFYPNPAATQAQLRVPAEWQAAWSYEMYDALGRMVRKEAVSGAETVRIDRAGLRAGMYLLRAESEFGEQAIRVLFE